MIHMTFHKDLYSKQGAACPLLFTFPLCPFYVFSPFLFLLRQLYHFLLLNNILNHIPS